MKKNQLRPAEGHSGRKSGSGRKTDPLLQLEERLKFEELISDLSASFVNISAATVDQEIGKWIRRIVGYFDVDRCSLGLIPEDQARPILGFEYLLEMAQPAPVSISREQWPWYLGLLLQGKPVVMNRIEELPPEAERERQTCLSRGIKSVVAVPLSSAGRILGSLAFVSTRKERVWPEDLVRRVRLVSEVFANALAHKRAEEALRESNERFRQVAENVADFIWEVDANGLYQYVSPSVEGILGYRPDELIGSVYFYDLFSPEVREELKGVALTALAAKESFRAFPKPSIAKDGRLIHLETSGTPILDTTGMLVGYRGADTDVTDRNEMENRIRTAAEEWRATFDSITSLVMILDRDCKVIRMNAAAKSFFGLPMEEVLGGRRCHVLMHGTEEPVGTCPVARMMRSGTHEETEFYDERRHAWLRISADPIVDEKGEIIRIVHLAEDITARKAAEAEAFAARRELLRADRLLHMGELTASLAHELNQPLTSILINARAAIRFVESGNIGVGELTEILQDIANDDKRAGNIIRSLKSILKQEDSERESIAINDVLRDVLVLLNSEAVIRKISIERDLADSLPPVKADRVQLQQVVLNLMMNAAESMLFQSRNRRTVIRTQMTDNGGVRVTIRDFGPGIDGNELPRIFDPFYTTKNSGLGMGLPLSRSIIENHGGRIWAENHPDGGMTFSFDLPGESGEGGE